MPQNKKPPIKAQVKKTQALLNELSKRIAIEKSIHLVAQSRDTSASGGHNSLNAKDNP